MGLLVEAEAAYRGALGVYTREVSEQDWAWTQNNLGRALRNRAAFSKGGERQRLFGEALSAFRAALDVYTQEISHKTGPRPRTIWQTP